MLRELREQRSQLVQTEDQYVFIHYAMLQYAFIQNVIHATDKDLHSGLGRAGMENICLTF